MKCTEVQKHFDELCREGDAFGRRDVAEHIERCEKCGSLFARWRGIAQKLSASPVPPPPEGFTQRIIASIDTGRKRAVILPFFPQRLAWAALLLITVGGLLAVQLYRTKTVPSSPKQVAAVENVHFEFSSDNAGSVTLVGDFNGWDTQKHYMRKNDDRTWSIDIPMTKGSYLYLFLVDGKEWRTDPLRGMPVPDGFGGYNSEVSL